jgi:ribosomal protein S18 acetylase RimI-like enzyme
MMIRPLSADDAAAYREVRLRGLREDPTAFGSSYAEERERSLEEVVDRIAPPREVGRFSLGAFVDRKLVGVLGLGGDRRAKTRHCAEIWGMYVLPEHRQKGIGRALMVEAITHARSLDGVRQIKLTVTATNTAARELYRSMGFICFGTEPDALFIEDRFYDEEYYLLRLDSAT